MFSLNGLDAQESLKVLALVTLVTDRIPPRMLYCPKGPLRSSLPIKFYEIKELRNVFSGHLSALLFRGVHYEG